MSDDQPGAHSRDSLTALISVGVLDAALAALVSLLVEAEVPLVVAARDAEQGAAIRRAFAQLRPAGRGLADSPLAGGVLFAGSLEDVVRMAVGNDEAGHDHGHDGGLPDGARDLGVVLVLAPSDTPGPGRIASAHYVRQVERDGAGHLQRRPPGLLAAWDPQSGRFDHFAWGITDELARRASQDAADFERNISLRAEVLTQLAAAQVSDATHIRRHLDQIGAIPADARH